MNEYFSFPGYCRLRMHNKGGAPVAFVEYSDVRCAAQALMALQGTYLVSSDRGGVRIEYARNKMAEVGNAATACHVAGGGVNSAQTSLALASATSADVKYNMHAAAAAAEMEVKMSNAAAANHAASLSQAVQGAPLHALGHLYGHHIWLGQ